MSRIKVVYVLGVVLAIYIGAAGIIEGTTDVHPIIFAIVLCALLAIFVLLPAGTGKLLWFERPRTETSNDMLESSIRLNGIDDDNEPKAPESDLEELTLIQSLKEIDFWLLFVVFLCVIGSGIMVVNNFGELVYSIVDVKDGSVWKQAEVPNYESINTLVSLFSCFNTLGRMIVGFLSDIVVTRYGPAARIFWLVFCSIVMLLTQLYFAFSVYVPMLYVGVVGLGIAYGGTFCIIPTLTLEFFGFKYFGTCLRPEGQSSINLSCKDTHVLEEFCVCCKKKLILSSFLLSTH